MTRWRVPHELWDNVRILQIGVLNFGRNVEGIRTEGAQKVNGSRTENGRKKDRTKMIQEQHKQNLHGKQA